LSVFTANTATTEVFYENKWRYAATFYSTIEAPSLFEDPLGGIFVVGGGTSNSIYYLEDASPFSKWQKLTQTLKYSVRYCVVIPLPDQFTNCTLV